MPCIGLSCLVLRDADCYRGISPACNPSRRPAGIRTSLAASPPIRLPRRQKRLDKSAARIAGFMLDAGQSVRRVASFCRRIVKLEWLVASHQRAGREGESSVSTRVKSLALVVLVFMSVSVLAGGARTPQNPRTDEAAIRQIVRQVQDGWNSHDGKAFAAPFAPDADYVVVNGMSLKGREAIENGHTAIFSTIYKDSRNVGTVKSVRFLRPDVAVVHVEWNLEFRAGGEERRGRAMNTMVMTKDGGRWNIVAFQNTPIQTEGR